MSIRGRLWVATGVDVAFLCIAMLAGWTGCASVLVATGLLLGLMAYLGHAGTAFRAQLGQGEQPSLPPVQTSTARILGNSSVKGGTASPGVERLFVPPPLPKP